MRRRRPLDVKSILQCGKKRYANQKGAQEAADRQAAFAADRDELLDLRVYQCPNSWCKGWHLTERRYWND